MIHLELLRAGEPPGKRHANLWHGQSGVGAADLDVAMLYDEPLSIMSVGRVRREGDLIPRGALTHVQSLQQRRLAQAPRLEAASIATRCMASTFGEQIGGTVTLTGDLPPGHARN